MDKLEFLPPVMYSPSMAAVPIKYLTVSFENIDFAGKTKLKDFLAGYLKEFKHDGRDSLLLYPGELAHQIFIALYREIASRVSAESTLFLDWPVYVATLRASWNKAEQQLQEDTADARFIFLLDLSFPFKEAEQWFCWILERCWISTAKLFAVTRRANVLDGIPKEMAVLANEKIFEVKIND